MRGSPILRAVLVLAVLLLLLVPLNHLTKPVTVAAPRAEASLPPATATTVHLELTSTRPFKFELLHLGRVVWSGESTANQMRKDVSMEFPKEGVDLELKGSWPGEESMAAIKLSVAPGEVQPVEKTTWGTKEFDEVLTFP